MHDADLVGHGEGLVLVVSDKDGGHALALQDLAHFQRKALAQVDVEVGEGLVEQYQFRLRRQCAGQCDTLLLAAGEFMRILRSLAGKANRVEQALDPFGLRSSGMPPRPKAMLPAIVR